MNDWNFQSRSHTCQACHHKFVDQEPYHTVLSDERGGYVRLDVCEKCWGDQYSQGATDRKGFVSHWRGRYECPAPVPDPIRKESAESLLRKLVERGDPQYAAASFILAVMLERKRVFKVKDQLAKDGKRIFVYEQAHSGDVFTIVDPNLQLNQLEEVQRTVAMLLEHGLPAESGTPASGLEPSSAEPDRGTQQASPPVGEGQTNTGSNPSTMPEGEPSGPASPVEALAGCPAPDAAGTVHV